MLSLSKHGAGFFNGLLRADEGRLATDAIDIRLDGMSHI
jgi:hypothetical protein